MQHLNIPFKFFNIHYFVFRVIAESFLRLEGKNHSTISSKQEDASGTSTLRQPIESESRAHAKTKPSFAVERKGR